MNYNTSQPNARYWTLKLLLDNFSPGDTLAETTNPVDSYAVQAFQTSKGKKLLILNKRNREQQMTLPPDASGGYYSVCGAVDRRRQARFSSHLGKYSQVSTF